MPNGGYLLIPSSIINIWDSYKQRQPSQLESGGILIGRRRDPHIELVSITEPDSSDIRHRQSFYRYSNKHREIATEAWRNSSGYLDYIGEWHTHPELTPSPSSIDVSEMKIIAKKLHPKIMVSVIVGIEEEWVGTFTSEGFKAIKKAR